MGQPDRIVTITGCDIQSVWVASADCDLQSDSLEDVMTRIRVAGFGVSLDGFAAGIEQSLDDPLGKRGPELFQWFFPTRTFREMQGGKRRRYRRRRRVRAARDGRLRCFHPGTEHVR